MTEHTLRTFLALGTIAVGLAAAVSGVWDPPTAWGLLLGGAWSLVNVWCLGRALTVWLEPPRRSERFGGVGWPRHWVHLRGRGWRTAWWILVKFPLWYAVAIGCLTSPGVSVIGFGIGFSVVLAAALGVSVAHLCCELQTIPSHGR